MEDIREAMKKELCSQVDALTDEELNIIAGGRDGRRLATGNCPVCGQEVTYLGMRMHLLNEHPGYLRE